jgi:hypothetical protein
MKKLVFLLSIVFLIGQAILYFAYINRFSFNFPVQDDVSLIEFIHAKESGSDLFNQLFRVDNDHAIVIPRVITWMNQLFHGSVNFKQLILWSALTLISCFFLLFSQFQKLKINLPYFIPVGFLLFQPQFFEVSNWAITGLQHINIIFFVCLSLIALEKNHRKLALLWALMAGFTFGNGIILFVVLAAYFIFTKRYKGLLACGVGLAFYLLILMPHYSFGQQAKFEMDLGNMTNYALGLLGATALDLTGGNLQVGILLGLLMFCYWVYLFFYKKDRSFFAYLFLFIIGTCLIIAIARSAYDWTTYNISRYFLYAPLAVICLYAMSLTQFPQFRKRIFVGTSLLSLIFCFMSYHIHTAQMVARFQVNQADNDNWIRHQLVAGNVPQVFNNDRKILQDAFQLHYLDQEAGILSKQELVRFSNNTPTWKLTEKMLVERHASTIHERNGEWIKRFDYLLFPNFKGENSLDHAWYIVLRHTQSAMMYTVAINFKKGSLRKWVLERHYLSNYGIAHIYTDGLMPGRYQVYLVDRIQGKNTMYRLDQSYEIKP